MNRIAVFFILLLAFCGIADSAYITQHEVTNTPLLCNIQNLSGCNVVAQSPYSRMFGIPLAEYGLLFYSIAFVLAALEIFVVDQLLRRALQALSVAGFIASLYFIFLQFFVINALCIYCLASAAIVFLMFVLASFIEPVFTTSVAVSPVPPPPQPPPPFSMPPVS